MKKIITAFASILSITAFAQTVNTITADTAKPFPHWKKTLEAGLNFGAANFSSNWQGGGVSNITVGSYLNHTSKYKSRDSVFRWENTVNLQYGVTKNKGQSMRKSADLIFIDSKLSYQFGKAWNFFFGANFVSQFAPGFEYGTDSLGRETRKKISAFMAPAYVTEALGIEYKPASYFSARLGLGATRQTFVLDQTLYNAVDTVRYGVPAGKKLRNELGFQILLDFNKDVFKNVNLKARYLGFANYEQFALNKIDHRFDIIITAKINKYINTSLSMVFLYDYDQVQSWQNSQVFALGIGYKFP
jgi:hypothetical protein